MEQLFLTVSRTSQTAGSISPSVLLANGLTFRFPANLPRELNGTPFYGVEIANGRIRPLAEFREYGRIKTIVLYRNDRAIREIQWADTWRWQKADFPDVLLNVGDTLALEIREIYPGQKFPTAAISEIVLQGAH